jgi:hypothetical protein
MNKPSMPRAAGMFSLLCLVSHVLLFSACSTSGPGRGAAAIDIRLSPPNHIEIMGERTRPQRLGRRLRSLRAHRHTRITIHTPRGMDAGLAAELRAHLVKLGYPMVVSARQKTPQVSVDTASGSGQP